MSCKKATLASKQEKKQIAKGIKRIRMSNTRGKKHHQNLFLVITWAHEFYQDYIRSSPTFAKNHQPFFFPYLSLHLQEIKMLKWGTSPSSKSWGVPSSWQVELSVQSRKSRSVVISLPFKDKVQSASQHTKWLHQLLAWKGAGFPERENKDCTYWGFDFW